MEKRQISRDRNMFSFQTNVSKVLFFLPTVNAELWSQRAACPVAAMRSLVFLCAQKVVSHYATLQDALAFIPKELYPVLFKAAFLDKRTPSLQQLVQTWPFPVLSFQKLLRKCQHCEYPLIREKPNKLCIQAVILGVVTYLIKMLEDRHGAKRYRRLHLLMCFCFSWRERRKDVLARRMTVLILTGNFLKVQGHFNYSTLALKTLGWGICVLAFRVSCPHTCTFFIPLMRLCC